MNVMKAVTLASAVMALSAVAGNAFANPVITVQTTGPNFDVLDLGTATSAGYQNSNTITDPGFADISEITFAGGSSSGTGTPPSTPGQVSGVYAGSVNSVATSPFPAGTPANPASLLEYLVAQANGGTVTITFSTPQTAFDLLWGTADAAAGYNVVTYGSGGTDTISGADILAAAGASLSTTGTTNYAVEVTDLPSFTQLTFSDSTAASAFEFDIGEVPEPASFALMAMGLGALAWVSRRRRRAFQI